MKIPSKIPTTGQDRMHFINQATCNVQIGSIVSFEGRVDDVRFARAVRLAIQAEPILGYRFVVRPWRPYWEHHPEADRWECCDLQESIDIEADVRKFLAIRIDPCQDPLVRLRLFRQGDNDTLCAKICHVVGDLGALREFIGSVARIYGRLEDDPDYVPDTTPVVPRGFGQVVRSMGIRRFFKQVRRGRMDFVEPGRWRLPLDVAADREPAYTFRRFTSEEYEAVVASAKAHRATLNALVLTAYFRGLCRWTGVPDGEVLQLTNTLDLRHYLTGRRARSVCNLSAPLMPSFQHVAGEPFAATLAQVAAEMGRQKRSSPGLLAGLFVSLMFQAPYFTMARFFGKIFDKNRNDGSSIPVFTDGGEVRFELQGTPVRNVIGIGPVAYPPTLFLSSGTCKGLMTWVVSHCKTEAITAAIEQLLEEMAADLLGSKPGRESVTSTPPTLPASISPGVATVNPS